jgi:hypothetical protein
MPQLAREVRRLNSEPWTIDLGVSVSRMSGANFGWKLRIFGAQIKK